LALEAARLHVPVKPLFVPPVFHVATNPVPITLESEVKSNCKYPVDDVYTLAELTEPESFAIS
jgi:hypothetical protein